MSVAKLPARRKRQHEERALKWVRGLNLLDLVRVATEDMAFIDPSDMRRILNACDTIETLLYDSRPKCDCEMQLE